MIWYLLGKVTKGALRTIFHKFTVFYSFYCSPNFYCFFPTLPVGSTHMNCYSSARMTKPSKCHYIQYLVLAGKSSKKLR